MFQAVVRQGIAALAFSPVSHHLGGSAAGRVPPLKRSIASRRGVAAGSSMSMLFATAALSVLGVAVLPTLFHLLGWARRA